MALSPTPRARDGGVMAEIQIARFNRWVIVVGGLGCDPEAEEHEAGHQDICGGLESIGD